MDQRLHDLALAAPVVVALNDGHLALQAEQERGRLGEPGFERGRQGRLTGERVQLAA
jgi:hypothetical protein